MHARTYSIQVSLSKSLSEHVLLVRGDLLVDQLILTKLPEEVFMNNFNRDTLSARQIS